MYGHPGAYWTFPETERRRRLIAGAVGMVLGLAIGVLAFTLGGVL